MIANDIPPATAAQRSNKEPIDVTARRMLLVFVMCLMALGSIHLYDKFIAVPPAEAAMGAIDDISHEMHEEKGEPKPGNPDMPDEPYTISHQQAVADQKDMLEELLDMIDADDIPFLREANGGINASGELKQIIAKLDVDVTKLGDEDVMLLLDDVRSNFDIFQARAKAGYGTYVVHTRSPIVRPDRPPSVKQTARNSIEAMRGACTALASKVDGAIDRNEAVDPAIEAGARFCRRNRVSAVLVKASQDRTDEYASLQSDFLVTTLSGKSMLEKLLTHSEMSADYYADAKHLISEYVTSINRRYVALGGE